MRTLKLKADRSRCEAARSASVPRSQRNASRGKAIGLCGPAVLLVQEEDVREEEVREEEVREEEVQEEVREEEVQEEVRE